MLVPHLRILFLSSPPRWGFATHPWSDEMSCGGRAFHHVIMEPCSGPRLFLVTRGSPDRRPESAAVAGGRSGKPEFENHPHGVLDHGITSCCRSGPGRPAAGPGRLASIQESILSVGGIQGLALPFAVGLLSRGDAVRPASDATRKVFSDVSGGPRNGHYGGCAEPRRRRHFRS